MLTVLSFCEDMRRKAPSLSERNDTKSGKRREISTRLSFNTACELGFRGSLDEWERLMGAVARRWVPFGYALRLRQPSELRHN